MSLHYNYYFSICDSYRSVARNTNKMQYRDSRDGDSL